MADKAREITDKKLKQMEREVSRIYNEAYDDISKKWNAYMKSHTAKVENALIELQKAIESGDQDRVKKARDYYVHTVKNVTVNNERFRSMRDETVAKISHTNEIALDYLNGNMASVYTVNYNAFSTEKVAGYSFALVNEQAIKELATTDKMLLPKKKVNIPKDEAWNKKLINSQMLQGILQGESIPKIAKRLRNVTNMNKVSAIRNARTMTTSAENKGRQDSFEKAQSDGVIMEREWIPAHDDRTRAWHLELGGVRVGVDEPWENEYGKIMYPGDPDADPANVYNCRCAIRARVKGFDWTRRSIINAASYKDTGIVEGDIEKINPEIMRVVSDSIATLNNRFPDIKDYLMQGGCYFDEEESDLYGVMSAITSINNNGPTISRFVFGKSKKNNDIYSSISNFEQYVAKSVESKWYMPCNKSHLKDYLESHEYGHVVQNYILNRDYSWKNFKTQDELKDAYNERCKLMYKELVKCGMESGIIRDLGASVDNLSLYSLKKAGEGITSDVFAESFANMLCGSPNEWGKTMKIYLKKKGLLK